MKHINSYSPEERRKIMFDRIQELIKDRNGKCLTSEYKNKNTKLLLECKNGHQWTTRASSILRGSWCRTCWEEEQAGKHLVLKDGLEQAKVLALKRSGECLSRTYINTTTPMVWKCNNGHTWEAPFSDIKRRTWCPQCSRVSGVRERLCKHYIEKITGHEFKQHNHDWLISSRGHPMELDGFCQDLSIAFEHHGEQHYKEITHFNRRNETLEYRKIDDQRKRDLCSEKGILLIEIPYTVSINEIGSYIFCVLQQQQPGCIVINQDDLEDIDFAPSNELKHLHSVAERQGGKCLSKIWKGTTEKHRFRCSKGHEWEALASNVIHRGTWCPICKPEKIGKSNRHHSVESMQKLAESKGGSFLSDSFESVNNQYRWQCSQGHQWWAAPADIKRKTWCPICSRESRKGTLAEMQEIARERGGKCLSDQYINSQTKILWECEHGHTWMAKPGNIKNCNSWCPYCNTRKSERKYLKPKPVYDQLSLKLSE